MKESWGVIVWHPFCLTFRNITQIWTSLAALPKAFLGGCRHKPHQLGLYREYTI